MIQGRIQGGPRGQDPPYWRIPDLIQSGETSQVNAHVQAPLLSIPQGRIQDFGKGGGGVRVTVKY